MREEIPTAVLLDLDDTILDDSGNVYQCWRDACTRHESGLGGLRAPELMATIERVRAWYWSDSERHRSGRLDLRVARREVVRIALHEHALDSSELVAKIAQSYEEFRASSIQPISGAIETVHWLRARGCRLALLTNGDGAVQRHKIDRFRLAELFDCILIEGEIGFGKPEPRVYQLALKELDVAPSAAWMVGDHLEWDVVQPKRMGIYAIWVDAHGLGLPQDHDINPDRIIRRLSDLRQPAERIGHHDGPASK